MSFVIRITALAGVVIDEGAGDPPRAVGEFVQAFDADAHDGRGKLDTTPHVAAALRFPSYLDAFTFWQQRSTVRPTRTDGKPNRPLTAFSVEIHRA